MIPSPNLDDRTYKDIVSEAISLIPRYCPSWTNHNPTDPGMTLVELFAWMTEMTIFRLNQVPSKTFLALLDLIGLSLVPPQASRVLLEFKAVEGYDKPVPVRKGLQVSTSGDGEKVVFESEKSITVSDIRLAGCVSKSGGQYSDHMADLSARVPVALFNGSAGIERFLYFSSPAFAFLSEPHVVGIKFDAANEIASVTDEIVHYLEWQFWDGKKWVGLVVARSAGMERKRDNVVFFRGPLPVAETIVSDSQGFFIRASLAALPDSQKPFDVTGVSTKLVFEGEGENPDFCLLNSDNMVFHELDTGKEFNPFGDVPKFNDTFYVACDSVLEKEASRVVMTVTPGSSAVKPEPNGDLVLKFEFWNGKEWDKLGDSVPGKKSFPSGPFSFRDGTMAFTQAGEVQFDRPASMKPCEVNGIAKHWMRVRIAAGDFGVGGQHRQNAAGVWEWSFDKPVKPPIFSRVRFRYEAPFIAVERVFSYSDFSLADISPALEECRVQASADANTVTCVGLFQFSRETRPMVYFGFSGNVPQGEISFYLKMDEAKKVLPSSLQTDDFVTKRSPRSKRGLDLVWEFWNGRRWHKVDMNDGTDSFHQSGFLEFMKPESWESRQEFGIECLWVRVVLDAGGFERKPVLKGVHLNAVHAWNRRTFRDETLATSSGGLSQKFKLNREPVLPGMRLVVREDSIPPEPERDALIAEEGTDVLDTRVDPVSGDKEIWVRWHQVDNFHASVPGSRHYVVDYQGNTVSFGDGRRGMIPPRFKNGIVIERYNVGGGSVGNIAARAVRVIRDNVPFIASVTNPYPAEGGADLESLDNLKRRASSVFKSLNRAVTAEDFEWLAMEASASVARAKCLSRLGPRGEVTVIVVPGRDFAESSGGSALIPTPELLRRVKEYLDARRLVGTVLKVEPPVYRPVSVTVRVTFKRGLQDMQTQKDTLKQKVRTVLHPLDGGDGSGWQFGGTLAQATVIAAVEDVDGVHHVDSVVLSDGLIGRELEKISLRDDELLDVIDVVVEERRQDS